MGLGHGLERPSRVEPPTGDETTGLKFTYANGVEMFHGGPSGCTFEGELGTIYVDRDKLESTPESIVKTPLAETDFHVEPSKDHGRNWLDTIKSRKQPICSAEVGHRTASVCHLANLGYQLRRPLTWDPCRRSSPATTRRTSCWFANRAILEGVGLIN